MATFTQQTMWTALPNGVGRKGPKVSVFVSPRLTLGDAPAATLDRFPDWMDWPQVVSKAKFIVQFGRTKADAEIVSQPDSKIWQAIFRPDLIVESHDYQDLSGKTVISYSAADMEDRLIEIARSLMGTGGALPNPSAVSKTLEDFIRVPYGPSLLKNLVAGDAKPFLDNMRKLGLADLVMFNAYHAPFEKTPNSGDPADPEVLVQGIDFHRMVSLLGQYSKLLRDCGLVLDLALDRALPAGTYPLSVSVDWATSPGVITERDITPHVSATLSEQSFEARSKNPAVTGRRLNLAHKQFRPVQVDLDGGILKMTGTSTTLDTRAVTISNSGSGKSSSDVAPMGLPTLRTAGIMVAQTGRGTSVMKQLQRSNKVNTVAETGRSVTLYAEDVTRGLRIDAHDGKGWKSLCRTDVTYSLDGLNGLLSDKDVEGFVQLGATEAPPGANPNLDVVLKLSEGLFQWDGWSLCAERPGVPIDNNGNVSPDMTAGMLPVIADQKARPGSLPRLRFGLTYRIRARMVDLAHNSDPWSAKDMAGATGQITFRRFEPIAPPAPSLVRTGSSVDVPGPGGSLLRMVIRSGDMGVPGANDTEDLRLMFPARSSVEMAERHGALDGADGRPDPSIYGQLTAREGDLGQITGGAANDQTYPVADAGAIVAPWLPDPAMERTRISLTSTPRRTIPGAGDSRSPNDHRVEVAAGPDWPNQRPFTLRLTKNQSDPLPFVAHQNVDFQLDARTTHEETGNVVSVVLPKGETLNLTISQMFEGKPDPADLWGIAAWLKEQMIGDAYDQIAAIINYGDHWAFTPSLGMEMIHAVQRPLVVPQPTFRPVQRDAGGVDAELSLDAPCHAESTADLILEGRWIAPVDNGPGGSNPAAVWESGRAFAETLTPDNTPDGTIELNGRHQFNDTRYRRVRYTLGGSSRFAEFFPPHIRNDRDAISVASDDVIVHIPNAAQPPTPKIARTVPVFDWLRDTSGTAQYSWRRAGLRVYLERPWFESGFGEMLGVILAPASLTGLSDPDPESLERLGEHVSRWAGDPIWRSRNSDANIDNVFPEAEAFPARSEIDDASDERWPDIFPEPERDLSGGDPDFTDLNLPQENSSQDLTVDVAGHPVSWDDEQQLYYADVMMDTNAAYQPFVSLAVSRFHPISVPGCHLSPAKHLEALQVLPERFAAARKSTTGWTVQLFGHPHGVAPGQANAGNDTPWPSVVRVEVQRATSAQPDEMDWETIEDASLADEPHVAEVNPNTSSRLPVSFVPRIVFNRKEGALYDAYGRFAAERPPRLFSKRMRTPGAGGGSAGTRQWRIRITEWERHDGDMAGSQPGKNPGSTERLVFAETFRII